MRNLNEGKYALSDVLCNSCTKISIGREMDVLLLVIDVLSNVVLFVPFFHGSISRCVFERFQLLTRQCIIFFQISASITWW